MIETLFTANAWGSPGGTGFLLISVAIFFWGLSKIVKPKN
jgi:hypothetical protein